MLRIPKVAQWLLIPSLLLPHKDSNATPTIDAPYRLTFGGQYEICRALEPIINVPRHGFMQNDPSPLTRNLSFRLVDWQKTLERKHIDLVIDFYRQYFPDKYTKENYENNLKEITASLDNGEFVFYTANADMDNSGKVRPLLRVDIRNKGKLSGGYYIYFPYTNAPLGLDERYKQYSQGELIFFKGRTFQFSEWLDVGEPNYWRIDVNEPYFLPDRSPFALPPTGTNAICKFVAK